MHNEDKQFFHGLLVGSVTMGLVVLVVFAYGLFLQTMNEQQQTVVIAKGTPVKKTFRYHTRLNEARKTIALNGQTYRVIESFAHYQDDLVYRALEKDGQVFPSLWTEAGESLLMKASFAIEPNFAFNDFYTLDSILLRKNTGERYELSLETNIMTKMEYGI